MTAEVRARAEPGAEKVRFLELLPHEFRARLAARPIGYLPMGTLEWHGEHSALGADALISEGLFVRTARWFGGIVFPPLFVGPSRLPPPPATRPLPTCSGSSPVAIATEPTKLRQSRVRGRACQVGGGAVECGDGPLRGE